MLRYTLLWLYVTFAAGTSLRNWFLSLCMTYPLIAVLERPDMPREMFGIAGLNPYNIIMLFLLFAWFVQKKRENLRWNMPANINRLFIIYLILVTISFLRMTADVHSFKVYPMSNLQGASFSSLFKSDFLNSVKYLIPGLLLLHGVNSRQRTRQAAWAVLLFGLLLSTQVVMKMLPALVGADDLATRALRVLDRDIGYHRVNIAAMTAGFSWAFFALISTAKSKLEKMYANVGFLVCTLAMALSGGRAGMLAWLGCGFFLALIRWRKLLIIGPLVGILALSVIPGLQDRLEEGFTEDSHEHSVEQRGLDVVDSQGHDLYAVTSGRVIAWPLVIEQIKKSPLIGYGKRAMVRLGITHKVAETIGTRTLAFGHPHNAYLELLLDHGILGGLPILLLFVLITFKAIPYIKNATDKEVSLSAGMAVAFLVTQSIAGFGSQSFYPEIGTVAMWSAIGIFMATLGLNDEKIDDKQPEKAPKVITKFYP